MPISATRTCGTSLLRAAIFAMQNCSVPIYGEQISVTAMRTNVSKYGPPWPGPVKRRFPEEFRFGCRGSDRSGLQSQRPARSQARARFYARSTFRAGHPCWLRPVLVRRSGTIFARGVLNRAKLRRASLGDADLTEADLANAVLERADLAGANLFSAKLSHADLRGVTI